MGEGLGFQTSIPTAGYITLGGGTPGNPTGTMLSREALEGVAAIAQRHDLLVISDELYEKFTYDGNRHHSIGALPGMQGRTITINGFSKSYSMTGWRVGYFAAPA